MNTRPNLDEYFMIIAKIVSIRSTCNSCHIGCVIVKDKQILSTGYNGALPGCKHCSSYYTQSHMPFCVKRNMNIPHANKQNFCVVSHAESNAVSQAAKKGISIDGSTIYCTLFPCYNCLKIMAIAGIKNIFYEYEYGSNNDIRDKYWKNQVLNSGIKLEKFKIETNIIDTVIESLQYPTSKRRLKATK